MPAMNIKTCSKNMASCCSMSRSGNPYDNAPMESFFSTLKTEWTHHYVYKTRSEAKSSLFEYIEMFYNSHRLNSSIGYRTPCEFEYDQLLAIYRVYFWDGTHLALFC